jgi:hypothetical protein
MALKAAMWIHGTIVEAENPADLTLVRRGWGTHFFGRQFTSNWFHFPIPTPVILDDTRPQLVKVFVFYQTGAARIINLHVYDGPRRVKAFDNLNLSGDHSGSVDSANSFVIDPPITILFGLGISVAVEFTVGDPDRPALPGILFTTAGADFAPSVTGPPPPTK